MKVKRGKHARRILTFYKGNFGFESPYKILVDGTFCKAALSFKVNIAEQVPKYFDSEVKLLTSACVMAECELFGSVLYGPLKVLRQYEVAKCGHKNPVPASHCLKSLIRKRNKQKYMLATQDPDLTEVSRTKPGIPLLYIAHNTVTIETPSEASKEKAANAMADKLGPTEYEHNVLKKLKLDEFGEQEMAKRKKKIKGPNPLSCKSKQHKPSLQTPIKEKKKRRKRKRIKVAEHIREHFKQQILSS
ncbi:rRNA-processing protein UTP23 homolog [Haliotis asinina]|uniref:rRNA-processing protein UTP23 homolog n=1 Tax=Haliotis asinina TaxID=109174 RepID=UPI003531C065